jgi:hypothetical protein
MSFNIPTGREGAAANLSFRHFKVGLDARGRTDYCPCEVIYQKDTQGLGTQVIAYISLWGRHLRYYRNYLACFSSSGLDNRLLSSSLWETSRAPAGYDGDGLTSHRFEDELNKAVLTAFEFALRVFIDNYNIAVLDDVRPPKTLRGFSTLLAPGRVSFPTKPDPPLIDMLQTRYLPEEVSQERLSAALRYGRRDFDKYQRQLLAMQRLSHDGESEIAIVGCVTAIEWFLNSLLITQEKKTLSIVPSLSKPMRVTLSPDLKAELLKVAQRRNAIVHGEPSSRSKPDLSAPERTISQIVRTGLELYREVQQQLKVGLLN